MNRLQQIKIKSILFSVGLEGRRELYILTNTVNTILNFKLIEVRRIQGILEDNVL
jgi:hypothetical protein